MLLIRKDVMVIRKVVTVNQESVSGWLLKVYCGIKVYQVSLIWAVGVLDPIQLITQEKILVSYLFFSRNILHIGKKNHSDL